MEKLTCSVVIVSYYTGDALVECLEAIFAEQDDNSCLIEVIIVDNGNAEKSKAYLAHLANENRIQWITGQGNVGFAKGCNLGVKHARQDTILLLNPDCITQPHALKGLLSFFKKEQTIHARTLVSGWLTNPDGSEQRGLRRNILTPFSLLIEMLPLIKQFPYLREKRLNLTNQLVIGNVVRVGACSGACMMLTKTLYQQLNGMDEAYFLHVDDLDFCKRLHNYGGQVLINTRVAFSHYQGASSASHQRVERHKSDGFKTYFSKHHALFWRSPLGWLLYLAIQLNYWRSTKKN